MAITLDTTSTATFSGTGTSTSWSHTCTGASLLLVAMFTNGDAPNPTGVTYNGVSMTNTGNITGFSFTYGELWYLVNPSSGANNVQVSWSGSSADNRLILAGISLTGTNTSNPIDTGAQDTIEAGQTSTTVNLTTTVDDCVLVDMVTLIRDASSPAFDWTAGGSQTELTNTTLDLSAVQYGRMKTSIKEAPTAGANSTTWSGSSQIAGQYTVAIAPAALGSSNFFTFF